MHLKQSKISLLCDDSQDRLHFKAMFHAVYLRKKSISTENNKLTIGYKMLLCLGLVLLTAGNIQPRFRLVNRTVSSRKPRKPPRVLPLQFTRANVHMDSGGTVVHLILLFFFF